MAKIRSFTPSTQNVKLHQTETDCEYLVIVAEAGTFLHLSTFGSDDRASTRKSSQSIQLDVEMARQLKSILDRAFPSL